MKTVQLHVDGMTCGHCSAAVKRALAGVKGVASVDVSLENKSASVQLNDDNVSPHTLINAIEEEGYKASV